MVDQISGPITRFELSPEDQRIIKKEHAPYLADSSWGEPAFVPDILIGGDYFWDFVKGEKEDLPSGLQLIPSAFGLQIGGLDKSDSNVRSEIQDKTALQEASAASQPEDRRARITGEDILLHWNTK